MAWEQRDFQDFGITTALYYTEIQMLLTNKVRQETVTDQEGIPALAITKEEQSKGMPGILRFPSCGELCSTSCMGHHVLVCAGAAGQEATRILSH